MNRSPVIRLDMPKEFRIKRIVQEYGNFPKRILLESIEKLSRRFGGDRTKTVMEWVESEQLEEATRMLEYYDQNYNFSFEKYIKGKVTTITANTLSASENAKSILKIPDSQINNQ